MLSKRGQHGKEGKKEAENSTIFRAGMLRFPAKQEKNGISPRLPEKKYKEASRWDASFLFSEAGFCRNYLQIPDKSGMLYR